MAKIFLLRIILFCGLQGLLLLPIKTSQVQAETHIFSEDTGIGQLNSDENSNQQITASFLSELTPFTTSSADLRPQAASPWRFPSSDTADGATLAQALPSRQRWNFQKTVACVLPLPVPAIPAK
ncbi:MAG: hypothetical protein HC922_00915 [Leptolyngbyaceae cyanobacterium SM2_3_12]|nr:hypothetical protein [Leptolyngbyaceae cyanobacterium SM2_3_12]